ncbi:hypothetical protein [Streptomyces sp. NPDC086023]|uniref:hypothetical protein n=1 Tax=Streptomyces sp. NPDC086023 TaxID=3365746 RepID=UPI0037CD58F3
MTATPDSAQVPPSSASPTWVLWLLIMGLFSLVVALSAGLLESLAGGGPLEVVRSGGTGFITAAGLCLATVTAVQQLRKRG